MSGEIVILDAGAQYLGLIDKNLRKLGVRTQVMPMETSLDDILTGNFEGVVISGGPDSVSDIAETIKAFLSMGADLLITTGGMSVDPDDVTRLGIMQAGADRVYYGAAVMPGTTWKFMSCSMRVSISSPPRPKTKGSPPFSLTTLLPASASFTSNSLISSCGRL